MATVCVDPDDFTTDTNGRLRVKLGCGLKHSDNGVVLASAEARSTRVQVIQDTDIAISFAGLRVTGIADGSITNPSDCRSMLVTVTEDCYHEVSVSPDGEMLLYHQREFNNDDDIQGTRTGRHHVAAISNESIRFGDRTSITYFRTVSPGATLNIRLHLWAQNIADAASSTFTYGTVQLNMLGVLV